MLNTKSTHNYNTGLVNRNIKFFNFTINNIAAQAINTPATVKNGS